MYHPTRGGARGGADQFNWEDIKIDKHRESYLGHSLKAPVGRWQKGKDLTWYNKDRSEKANQKPSARCELENIKKAEEEAMLVAFGRLMTVTGNGRVERKTVIAEVPLVSDETRKKADKTTRHIKPRERKDKNSKKKKKRHKKHKKKEHMRDVECSGEYTVSHVDSRYVNEQPSSKRRRHDSGD
ncbi:uncharacterized protein LOC143238242 isoform X2 [Tachypleus tridentatus]|uniref:uncharacterized protein LOC143238242 isoform X2 n=1 Tax=Tachypleus tridentatus TaxID=6853 RepID=UPI003FD0FDC2